MIPGAEHRILVFSRCETTYRDLKRNLNGSMVRNAYLSDGHFKDSVAPDALDALIAEEGPFDLVITTHQDPLPLLNERGYLDRTIGISALPLAGVACQLSPDLLVATGYAPLLNVIETYLRRQDLAKGSSPDDSPFVRH